MQRRDFLIHAAVIGGAAVVGLPQIEASSNEEESPEANPNYTLFGVKPYGCALSRSFQYQSDPIPEHIARLLG